MKKILLKTLLTIVLAGILFFLIILGFDIFNLENTKLLFSTLSNGAFFVGVIFLGIGLLVLISKEGTFDSLSYCLSKAWELMPFVKKKSSKTYFEYKSQKRHDKSQVLHMMIAGAFFVSLSIIFLIFYYKY
ncbi:MAG: DUF3899 domain-containing protein [Clostridiales bacterium]|jgi:hypothetical protein|nr:DUF3899 domain-containing protein [Clostridiales bacterium]